METTRAQRSYATALNRNELFSSPGLRRDIPALLDPEEEVMLALPGVAGDFPDVLIVTVRRTLLAAVAGPLRRARIKKESPAGEVTGVSYSPGLLSRVAVTTTRGTWRMLPHRRADAERFTAEFDHLLRTGTLPS
ncbi:hypothetical protein JSY14_03730 [Brachybacterium sp. EF45031]|uniref:hypothetical protein n=1 Tax=Brachybacterium sillae TaxID=2810536 RepID=UPI00217DBFB0|nr:hypothetical protein [Brachybacterium sillae]MCS6711167.1 hypothetical protein [Brachybacterium sillae]